MKNVTTKHTSLNLPESLLTQARKEIPQIFITGKQSYVPILNALLYTFTQPQKACQKKLPYVQTLQQNYHSEKKTIKIYPSLPLFLLDAVREKYQTDTLPLTNTQTIELALIDTLTSDIKMEELLTGLPFPYPFSGTKNAEICKLTYQYLSNIWDTPNRRHYIEPFTGSGALFFALPLHDNWQYTLNDLDANKINFLRSVKYRLPELMEKIWNLLQEPKRYIKSEAYLPKNWIHKFDNPKYPNHLDVEMGARYFIYRHQKRRKNSAIMNNTAYRQLAFLPLYSAKLRKANAALLCMDALAFMDTLIDDDNTLFLVDSPYPFTERYYNDIDGKFYRKHLILSKRCHKIAESDNGVFMYFCRTTPPVALYRKTPEKVPQKQDKLNQKIDSLYAGKGYFKYEYPVSDYVTECLISNYSGLGGKPY